MRIAVLNEVSACSKNADIINALKGFDFEICNLGMTDPDEQPQLTYIHTGLMAAALLNLKAADFVIGGCGTGQGFLISAMQYPNVFCGLISEPSDAYLFSLINNGNCISLPLLKGYGWAGELNLKFIFEKLFSQEGGGGYPASRSQSQKLSRNILKTISQGVHLPFDKVLRTVHKDIVKTAFNDKFVGFLKNNADSGSLEAVLNILSEVIL